MISKCDTLSTNQMRALRVLSDPDTGFKMTVSIWEMTVSIWSSWMSTWDILSLWSDAWVE